MKHARTRLQTTDLPFTEIDGNLLDTRHGVQAWYDIPTTSYPGKTTASRVSSQLLFARRLAGLAAYDRAQLRIDYQPFPVKAWADRRYTEALEHIRRAAELDRRPAEEVQAQVAELGERIATEAQMAASSRNDEKVFGLGITLGPRRGALARNKEILSRDGARFYRQHRRLRTEFEHVEKAVRTLSNLVREDGMRARPLEQEPLQYLVHRSTGLGLPPPVHMPPVGDGRWSSEQLWEFVDQVAVEPLPFRRATRVIGMRTGEPVITRYVSVVTIGKTPKVTIGNPELLPWLADLETLDFPVQVNADLQVHDGPALRRKLDWLLNFVARQRDHRDAHEGEHSHADLEASEEAIDRIQQDLARGEKIDQVRTEGHWLFAVEDTELDRCIDKADALVYHFDSQGIQAHNPGTPKGGDAQARMVKAFVPGARHSGSYVKHLPVKYIAGGEPRATSHIGDRSGAYYGYTGTVSTQAVHCNPYYPIEVLGRGSVLLLVGAPGRQSGKSTRIGELAEDVIRFGGAYGSGWDPAGKLARALKRILGPYCTIADLRDSQPGALSPWHTIPYVPRDRFEVGDKGDQQYERAKRKVERQRRELARDGILMAIHGSIASESAAALAVGDAVRAVGGAVTGSMSAVADWLARDYHDTHLGRSLAGEIRDLADDENGHLFFGTPTHIDQMGENWDNRLVVFTLQGLVFPNQNRSRSEWTGEERISMLLATLAASFSDRRTYALPPDVRKFFFADEVGLLTAWDGGEQVVDRKTRNGRKEWEFTLLAGQRAADHRTWEADNFATWVEHGGVLTVQDAVDGERLLGAEPDSGFAQALLDLGRDEDEDPRTRGQRIGQQVFDPTPVPKVVRDWWGGIDHCFHDMRHKQDVLRELVTTPGAKVTTGQEVAA